MAGFNREHQTRRKKREGEEQEVNQAAALSDLVIFRSYVTHKSEEMKENDQGRQKKGSCLYTGQKLCCCLYNPLATETR